MNEIDFEISPAETSNQFRPAIAKIANIIIFTARFAVVSFDKLMVTTDALAFELFDFDVTLDF
jgi:hypothetical protein